MRAASRFDQAVEVTEHERALREDRERVPRLSEGLDDALRQPVLPLGALVGIGVGAHRDVMTLPAPRRELGPELLHRVHLHDDHAVEVGRRVEVQVLVRRPGKAVVTDDAVCDEVAGASRDVVHRHLDVERLNGSNPQPRLSLECRAFDCPLTGDRRIDGVKEAKAFVQSSSQAH